MVDIALAFLREDGVQLLLHGHRGQGADGEDLGLASGEQAGAVNAGQNGDLSVERTDVVHAAAVHALAREQPLLDDLLLHLVQADLDVLAHREVGDEVVEGIEKRRARKE